jgi:hypothetical protein
LLAWGSRSRSIRIANTKGRMIGGENTVLNIVSVPCPCCGATLMCPWQIVQVGKIVEKVAIMVQIPWNTCPTCDMSLDNLKFHTPQLGIKHKPGMKGLR